MRIGKILELAIKILLACADSAYLIFAFEGFLRSPNWKYYLFVGIVLLVFNVLAVRKFGLKWRAMEGESLLQRAWYHIHTSIAAGVSLIVGAGFSSLPWYVSLGVILGVALYIFGLHLDGFKSQE